MILTLAQTIFATPVFDFKNDWQDTRLKHIGPSGDQEGSSGDRHMSVLSGYFWWYILSSISLSALTLIYWWYYTKREEDNHTAASNRGEEQLKNTQGSGSKAPVTSEQGSPSETTRLTSEKITGNPLRWLWHPRSWDSKLWFGRSRQRTELPRWVGSNKPGPESPKS